MSLFAAAERFWRKPWARRAVLVLAFGSVTVVTVLIARYQMFTIVLNYEDEGYMLVALKSFVNHGSLYDYVFTQYGPFFYEVWGGLFSLFGIPVTQGAGRNATLVVWVLTSLGLGLATMRITRSMWLGLAVQMTVFLALAVLTNEPMHPGGLICLMLAVIVGLSCFMRERPSTLPAALLGGAVAGLILTKINVGAFALVALALACVVSYPALASRRWLRLPVEAAFVVLPLVLLSSDFDQAWARHYAVHISTAALAVVIVLRARSVGKRPTEELWWIAGGLVAVGVASCAAIIGSGTSLHGLIEGVITQPLHQGDAFTIPLALSNRTFPIDLLALAGAIAYWFVSSREREPQHAWVAICSLLSVLIGLELALSVIGKGFPSEIVGINYQFNLLAFAWVALIPLRGDSQVTAFARLLLPPLAVLQTLHAFPVAGSQVVWGTFLLAPVGAICVANGVRGLAQVITLPSERQAIKAVGVLAAIGIMIFLVDTTLRDPLRTTRALYNSQVLLDLPGSGRVRLGQKEVDRYRAITAAIDQNCSSFLELPGMGDFYIWSDQEPPTGYFATAWPTLFDDAHQERVVEQTRSIENLCLLRNNALAEGWSQGPVPDGPLVKYLEEGFQPIANIEGYELLKRAEPLH